MTVMLVRQARSSGTSAGWTPKACVPADIGTLLANCNAAKAMRYYRLWIYTCNGALLLAVLVFCAVAGRTLVGDYRRRLVPGFALHQPSLLCAGAALLAQAGFLQAVGCAGALRLNERLLNAYWLMMLALLLGDVAVGVFWVFRLEQLCRELKPGLRMRLSRDYGTEPEFTALWDRFQREARCCGVQGVRDFGPPHAWARDAVLNATFSAWPPSCCGGRTPPPCPGCDERLLAWVRHTADVLFVLGYCVIAFLKLCFLGILRYEIREMIQKIKMLQNEVTDGAAGGEGGCGQPIAVAVNANGTVRGGEREALLGGAARRDSDATSGCALLGEEALELREMGRGRRLLPAPPVATSI
ncbi:tetraspanin-1-like [Arctopsyche grandis]|uniref:tetraspanin-1-like n=1 Tax=Arctopsyche grandis TaxID=121162 RepID=UPI00406D8EC9